MFPLAHVAGSSTVIDDLAKDYLHRQLAVTRKAVVWKLDGLSEYDVRRPLTVTGTNLLGLVKHLATGEARYLGEVFGRPFPEPLPRWQDADGSDLWVTGGESRDQIVGFYRRTWAHADATIAALPLDAPGQVPWWPRPGVTLFAMMAHVLQDTTRHAGHADILREQLDGLTGASAEYEQPIDTAARAAHRDTIERAARRAAPESVERRPRIVVLCGSVRFHEQFQEANHRLTTAGKIVLSIGFRPDARVDDTVDDKAALDELHKRKIDLADEVFVLNVGGYLGESTRSEIDYAEAAGKPITYLEPPAPGR